MLDGQLGSPDHVLEGRADEIGELGLVGHNPLQPSVLALQLLEPFDVVGFSPPYWAS